MITAANIFHYVNPYHEAISAFLACLIAALGLGVYSLGLSYNMSCRNTVRDLDAQEEVR